VTSPTCGFLPVFLLCGELAWPLSRRCAPTIRTSVEFASMCSGAS
jgi:hypothetical protein